MSIYRYRIDIGASDIGIFWYVDVVSVTTEIQVVRDILSHFFRLLRVNLKTSNHI